jgi:hypothetical protein
MTKFEDNWKFSNEVRVKYGTYTKQSFIQMGDKTFKTGRQKYIATFTTQEGQIYRHEAMQFVSKEKKKIYYKVSVITIDEQKRRLEAKKRAEEEAADDAANAGLCNAILPPEPLDL